jgi:hypothetical protein
LGLSEIPTELIVLVDECNNTAQNLDPNEQSTLPATEAEKQRDWREALLGLLGLVLAEGVELH